MKTLLNKIMALSVLIPTFGLMAMSVVVPTTADAQTATQCSTVTFVSDSSTQTSGYTQTNPGGATLGRLPTSYSGGAFSSATPSVAPSSWVNPAIHPNFIGSGAVWISTIGGPGHATFPEGTGTNDQWRLFRETFSLPAGATITSATLTFSADNATAVYLNGNNTPFANTHSTWDEVYGSNVTSSNNYGDTFTESFTPVAGSNTIDFVVRNWAGDENNNPTGLLYKIVVEYCVPVPSTPNNSTVTITKYIEGMPATSATASSTSFLFQSSWNASNLGGSGTGQFSLIPGSYSAVTSAMNNGSTYTVQELNSNGSPVATSCTAGGPRYVLSGYTTGSTMAQAVAATPSMTAPNFTNLTGNQYVIVWNRDCTIPVTPNTVQVNIAKYIQGMPATATSASSSPFLMSATWSSSNVGSGTGQYSLVAGGSNPYQASTVAFNSGASYATSELMSDGSNATTTCASGQRYVLQGYTTGNSWIEAQNGTTTLTSPSFTNLTQDKYVIVWNRDCNAPTSSKIHVLKYVNGVQANASSTNSTLFPMMSTWQASNLNGGAMTSGTFFMGNNHGGATSMYGAQSSAMNGSYYYTLSEQTGTSTGQVLPQGSSCVEGRYRLDGYRTSSVSFANAASASLATTSPVWTNGTGDQYVIVYNTLCATTQHVPLSVSVTPIKTTGVANNTYEDGWRYVFHVTAPSHETNLSMKFNDWVGAVTGATIPVAGNMRISSSQATNGPFTITAHNTYSAALNMNADLNPLLPGRQVEVVVEVKIPVGSVNTSYTTNFGVQTLP